MDWIWGVALLPFLICGVMCLGGIALAAIGLRRSRESSSSGRGHGEHSERSRDDHVRS